MAEIVQSLFGVTPQAYQQAQQDRMDAQALQYARLDPFQQANYAIGRGASGLAGAIGGALGGQDPELQRITRRQQIAGQLNPNDLSSFEKAMAELAPTDPQGAMMVRAELEKIQMAKARLESENALTSQRKAAAEASGREKVQPIPTTNDLTNARAIALAEGPEGSPEYNAAFKAEYARLTAKTAEKPVNPRIDSIGLAGDTKDKGKNVYVDPINDIQFTYGVDAAGKQIRVPFTGTLVQKTSGEGGGGGAAGTGTVEVVDPKNPTKTIIVTKAEAVANRLTPAKAIEGLTPQMRQNLEKSYPQATSSLRSYQAKSTSFIKDLENLRDSEGLDPITGFAAGRAPGFSDAGRAAVALYDKVVAKGGFQTLQDMRDMSKTGGALGNVSDRENTQLKAAFAAIDRKQSAADVRLALSNLIEELKGGQGRLKDAYDLTYEYKKANTAPTASGVDATNPLLK